MAIRWDPLLTRHVARELDEVLRRGRLRAVRLDARSRDVVLFFRDGTLLWRLHPERGMPRLLDPLEPQEGDLRLRARVRGVTSPPDERLVRIELVGERRGRGLWEIVFELLGNRMNAIVAEGPERTIRHVLRTRRTERPLAVGHRYVEPAAADREGADCSLTEARWAELLDPVPPPARAGHLLRHVAWTSRLNVDVLLSDDGYRTWRRLCDPRTEAEPHLLATAGGHQPYPFPVGPEAEPVESLLEAFSRCEDLDSGEGAAGDGTAALRVGPELLERLSEAVARAERRIVRLEAELERREDPDALRKTGDLILARYARIPAGATEATLEGFEGEPVSVELDPQSTPHENAAAYYARASRSARTAERIPHLVTEAQAERDRLLRLRTRALAGEVEPGAVRAALPLAPARQRRGAADPNPPYRRFRSSGGLEIRVGRGARHNDDLTFRHSSPDDVWLHARHAAGAHVVLRWPHEGSPPARDLEEAAILAAVHSKARTSGSVPVDWTRRKHVRKPRGSKPGSVVPDRVKTLFVQPDEALVEALAAESPPT